MLLLLHSLIPYLAAYTALIPCHAAYKYTALIPCDATYSTGFSTFWHCHPYILQILMEMFLLSL